MKWLLLLFVSTQALAASISPRKVNEFDADKVEFAGDAVSCSLAALGDTDCDYTLSENLLLVGTHCFLNAAAPFDDYITFQVVAGGTLLSQFVNKWYLSSGTTQEPVILPIPALLPAGVTIRLKYHNTGITTNKLKCNLHLYRPK